MDSKLSNHTTSNYDWDSSSRQQIGLFVARIPAFLTSQQPFLYRSLPFYPPLCLALQAAEGGVGEEQENEVIAAKSISEGILSVGIHEAV